MIATGRLLAREIGGPCRGTSAGHGRTQGDRQRMPTSPLTAVSLKLGEQVVLKSPEAFARLKFAGFSVADHLQYYPRRQARLEIAEKQFLDIQSEGDFMEPQEKEC